MDYGVACQTTLHTLTKIKTIWQNRSAYIKAYLWPLPKFRREVVVMVDGIHTHGGITDRLRNILSVYLYCKKKNIPFFVYYIYPCLLEKFLLPNLYDWRIRKIQLSYSRWDTKEISLYVDKVPEPHDSFLDEKIRPNEHQQYHIYGNCRLAKGHYRELFQELFKPSDYLAKRIADCMSNMPEPFEAVTLRFQQLLGDFEEGEGQYSILPYKEQQELISHCKEKIEKLYADSYFATRMILVTSDSPTFLYTIKQLPFVYTIPGKMEHMDYTHNKNIEINAKPFIDLLILSKAQRITLLVTGKMYRSGFPGFAAEIGGRTYKEIIF